MNAKMIIIFLAQDTAFEDMLRYSRKEALQTYFLKHIDILREGH